MLRAGIFITLVSIAATGCTSGSEFEKFANQECIDAGRYPGKRNQDYLCSCNAKLYDQTFTDEEKRLYRDALLSFDQLKLLEVFGDPFSERDTDSPLSKKVRAAYYQCSE